MSTLAQLRQTIRANMLADEPVMVERLAAQCALSEEDRRDISAAAAKLVRNIRDGARPGLMEIFLAEYGLSTDEGVALMCLAEALLRVPDADTMDALIEDKIAPSDWGKHIGHSASPLVNASTWALMLTGKVLGDEQQGVSGHLHSMVKRLGEPVIRTAVARAMKEMGRQFVLGETIQDALGRAVEQEEQGYSYSYDMLGEAACTEADAKAYLAAYHHAIETIATAAVKDDIRDNPGISVKLSALYPRYEQPKRDAVLSVLAPRLLQLCQAAATAGIGLNIDAEEADRLDLSLDIIETVLADEALKGWHGFGVVVQAYGPRAGFVIDWLNALATRLDRKIMVRLVKGAYWDTEIKRAQVLGLEGFPVFTRKSVTDLSYIANARKLLQLSDRIYPQFATHNAHTAAAILHMAEDKSAFEFQRLQGMGERLHDLVLTQAGTRCRIYAPVGAHRDLLAYLVRRLLENGANSSFVNQIVDEEVSAEEVAADPITAALAPDLHPLTRPSEIFPGRHNSKGWDWTDPVQMLELQEIAAPFLSDPLEAVPDAPEGAVSDAIGKAALWDAPVGDRAEALRRAADLYEAHAGQIFAILIREAGKTWLDAIGELREAVDFLRFYAAEADRARPTPRGVFACISPWNFPLAIFTGQIAAALAAGNAVIAKPAEQTRAIAGFAVSLLHAAGVPNAALQLVQGGGRIGATLTSDPRLAGVCFTGSTATAQAIHRSLAAQGNPEAVLIAETGGLNAMVVDSTALPEQAVRDILASAFQSAGQRCSALRCVYVQDDIAPALSEMLIGAMAHLSCGDPVDPAMDIGPIIDPPAHAKIAAYVAEARDQGRVLFEGSTPEGGRFIAPTLIEVPGIEALREEIFGPVLHLATFKSEELSDVITAINATGYGLTFGLHTRIDDRVQDIVERVEAGNIYVNRNQIGAVVGSQPFGGEGLSGTGPKAGGPNYLAKFAASANVGTILGQHDLPGPTGEANRLTLAPKTSFACLGPDPKAQMQALEALGATAFVADIDTLAESLNQIAGVLWSGDLETARTIRAILADHTGPILPLITTAPRFCDIVAEHHVCIDTTASGGNAALLAEVSASAS